MRRTVLALILIVIIIVAAGAAYAYYNSLSKTAPSTTSTTSTATFTVALTDPPSVPQGTSALYLNYSEIELITNSSPYYAKVSGSVNLLSLINQSKILANFNINKNVKVNQIRFYVSEAKIVINGTSYPVIVPSSVLKIPVTNATTGALIDLRPHIVTAYVGGNETFIMTPVALAVPFNVKGTPGQQVPLTKSVINELSKQMANVSVVSATLSSSGNITTFSITMKNAGKEPVVIYALKVYGNWSLTVSPFSHHMRITSVQVYMPVLFFVNGTNLVAFSAPHSRMPYQLQGSSLNPFSVNGYILQPGETVTLTFEGTITPAPHAKFSASVVFLPISGQSYRIETISAPPSFQNYTLTAKS